MIVSAEGRWPPVYDAEGLARVIRELVRADDFGARFWELRRNDSVFQGDVIQLRAPVPHLDEEGAAVASTHELEHWLVIGNTCDFDRDLADVEWTQLVPLIDVGSDLPDGQLANLVSYQAARKFYVPPWPNGGSRHHVADFLRPVTIHKSAFDAHARVVAQMQFPAWVLLHSCLVRFLCRDDGRFD